MSNIEEIKGCFAYITDDDLLRENGLLYAENEELKSKLQQKDNIIKEVREILESKKHCERLFGGVEGKSFIEQALEILDKGDEK